MDRDQYVFPIDAVALVTDFRTGKVQIKRTIGANHADCEPLTAKDAAVMKLWEDLLVEGRAVIIETGGRKLAASMSSIHGIQYIGNFNGHFDVHFKTHRHMDGKITPAHQEQIRIAAGV